MKPTLIFVPIPPCKSKLTKQDDDFTNLFKSKSGSISTYHGAISSEKRDINSYRPYISALSEALDSSAIHNKTLNSKFTDPFHPKSKESSSSIIIEMINASWNCASDLMNQIHSLDASSQTSLKSMKPLISDLLSAVDTLNNLVDPSLNHDFVTKAGQKKEHPFITPDIVHALKQYAIYIADTWQLSCILSKNQSLTPPLMVCCLNDISECISSAQNLPKEAASFFISSFKGISRYLQLLVRLQLGKNSEEQQECGQAIAYYNSGIEISNKPIFLEGPEEEPIEEEKSKHKEKSKKKDKDKDKDDSKKKDKDESKKKEKEESKKKDDSKKKDKRFNTDIISELTVGITALQEALSESYADAKTANQKIFCQPIPESADLPSASPQANIQPSPSLFTPPDDGSNQQGADQNAVQGNLQQTQNINQQQQQLQQQQLQQLLAQNMDPSQLQQLQQLQATQQMQQLQATQQMQQLQATQQIQQLTPQQQMEQLQLQQQLQYQQFLQYQQQLQQQQLQQQQQQQQQQKLQQQQLQQQLLQQQLQQQQLQQQQLQQQQLQQQQLQQQQPQIQQQQPQQPQIQQTQHSDPHQFSPYQQLNQQQQATTTATAANVADPNQFQASNSPVNDWMKVLALKEQAKSGYEAKLSQLQQRFAATSQAEQAGTPVAENSAQIQAKIQMTQQIIQCFPAAEKNDEIIQKNVFQYQAAPKEEQLQPINIMINKSYQFYMSTLKQLNSLS